MLKIPNIIGWLFVALFAAIIPSTNFAGVKFVDEAIYMALLVLMVLDCCLNRRWKNYGLAWLVLFIMSFYLVYSLFFVRFNTMGAVVSDFIVEPKQYMAFAVVFCGYGAFTVLQRQLLRKLAMLNCLIAFLSFFLGIPFIKFLFGHVALLGSTIFLSSLVFLYTSIDERGCVSKRNLILVTLMLLSGLVCTRSKYYGECVLAIFFLYAYKPGMFRKIDLRHVALLIAVLALVLAVSWHKIQFYFLNGTGDVTRFDPDAIESFARPVLYATGALVLIDYFPFGSGFASFASNSSAKPYSGLYHEYGIDKVYGLSESMPDFICDAYYPLLAQFGVVGLCLFILFWIYVCQKLRKLIRMDEVKNKYCFIIGSLIVCYVLIESIAGTMFAQPHGVLAMMLLGIIASKYRCFKSLNGSCHQSIQSVTKKYI